MIYVILAIAIFLIPVTYFVSLAVARRRIREAQTLIASAHEQLISSQEELNDANENLVLMHCGTVGALLDALDAHFAEKTMPPELALLINEVRPYYEVQTIH